jgi:3-oxoacyl-(acyl-carrier-protein) synthase
MNEFSGMVLTGVGLVSPAGTAKGGFFSYLRDTAPAEEETARWSELQPGQLLRHLNVAEPKLRIARYLDPVSRNAMVAVREAMTDAGIEESRIADDPFQYGIVFGTTRGACLSREGLYDSFASRQGKMVSGTIFSHCGHNIAGAMAAIAFGVKGPNLTVAGRGDLGVSVLGRARQLLVSRRAHTVFAGFTECDGARRRSNGSFAELAYVLCLERKDRAAERGAAVLAEVRLEPVDVAAPRSENDIVCGLPSWDAPLDTGAEALALSLPGMKAVGDRYASLLRVGLLAHDPTLKAQFPAVAFSTLVGKTPMEVRLLYGAEENQPA